MNASRTSQIRKSGILGILVAALTGGLAEAPLSATPTRPASISACAPAVSADISVADVPWGITMQPDEQRAFIAHPGIDSISVIDTESNTLIVGPTAISDGARDIAFSPSGEVGYVADSLTNTVTRIDPATPGAIPGPIVVGISPYAVLFSPDGSRVYVANAGDNSVSVIDTSGPTVTSTIAVGNFPYAMAISADGRTLYVANFHAASVSIVDTDTGTVTGTIIGLNGPVGAALSPDGSRLYVPNYFAGTVSVIDTSTNSIVGTPITVGTTPHGIAISPDGEFVIVTNQTDNTISIIDTSTDLVVWTISVGAFPFDVAINADGRRAYVTNYSSDTVSVIDMNCPVPRRIAARRLTFDPSGGECAGHTTNWIIRFRGHYQLPSSTECHRDGHVFLGWTRDPARTSPDDILTTRITDSADLTAVWAALPPAPTIIGVLANFLCFNKCDSVLLAWSSSSSPADSAAIYLDDSETECLSRGRLEDAEWCWISGLTSGTTHAVGIEWNNAYGTGLRSSAEFSLL